MSKGFITGTNEELIKAYKESRDESYVIKKSPMYKGIGTMDCAYSRGA